MAFVEGGGGLCRVVFRDQVIGGRGGVGQHHVRLALEEQAIGLGPAGGDGDDVVRERLPDRGGVVAMGGLHPHQKAEPRGRGPGVLDQDRDVAVGKIPQAGGRLGKPGRIVDEGEISPVEGQKERVVPVDRQIEREVGLSMRGEKAGSGRAGGEIGVEAQHDIGVAARALELKARQQGRAVASADELQVAAAGFLERCFDGRAGTPLGDEAVIGVDGENGYFLCLGRKGRDRQKRRHGQGVVHGILYACRAGFGRGDL